MLIIKDNNYFLIKKTISLTLLVSLVLVMDLGQFPNSAEPLVKSQILDSASFSQQRCLNSALLLNHFGDCQWWVVEGWVTLSLVVCLVSPHGLLVGWNGWLPAQLGLCQASQFLSWGQKLCLQTPSTRMFRSKASLMVICLSVCQ